MLVDKPAAELRIKSKMYSTRVKPYSHEHGIHNCAAFVVRKEGCDLFYL